MIFLEKLKEKKIHVILIIISILIIGIALSLCLSKKEYISVSKILLIKSEVTENGQSENRENIEITSKLIHTFKELLKSDSSIQKIKDDLNLNLSNKELKNDIDIKINSNSDTFQIQVKSNDENNSLKENQKLIDILSDKLDEMYENREIYIVDTPHINKVTTNISIILCAFISLVIGILVSSIYVFAIAIIDRNIKINENIDNEINLKKLIEIPLINCKKSKSNKIKNELISTTSESKSVTLKAFRDLRTNIQFINVNNKNKNIILITSPLDGEGKSYITANLGVIFAESGKKVVIIDSDMQKGRQNKIFNIPNNLGFSNYLSSLDSNGMEIKKLTNNFINETGIKNLNLITSGTVPPNSTELLTSERLQELIKDLSVFYDLVLIDGTSVLNNMNSLILTRAVNSTIIVSDYKKTKKEDLFKAKKDIQNVGGNPMGIIINKTKFRRKISFQDVKTTCIKAFSFLKLNISKLIENLKNQINKLKDLVKEKQEEKKQKLLMAAKIDKIEQKKQSENKEEIIVEKLDNNKLEDEDKENENKDKDKDKEEEKDESNKVKDGDNKKEEQKEESKESLADKTNNENKEKTINIEDSIKTIIPEIEIVDKNNNYNKNSRKTNVNNIVLINNSSSRVDKTESNFKINNYLANMAKSLNNLKEKTVTIISTSFNKAKTSVVNFGLGITEKIEERKKEKEFDKIYLNNIENEENTQLSFDNFDEDSNIEKENNANSYEGQETFDELQNESEINAETNIQNAQEEKNETILKEDNKELEAKRIEQERIEQEKREIEKREAEKQETERKKLEKQELERAKAEKKELKKDHKKDKKNEETNKKNNAVLIFVDAEEGYCRVFSEKIFVEKIIRGIDKNDGFEKKHYSRALIHDRMQGLIGLYGITKKQAQRIDTLVYTTLCDYDDSVWIKEKIVSNKADTYAYCMSKNYDRLPNEKAEDYDLRCKRLRIKDLKESNIELEYKLNNIWTTNKINISDKLSMIHFSKIYEIDSKLKNDLELKKSMENRQFYESILEKFDSKSNIDAENIETENTGIYEIEKDEEDILSIDKKVKQEEQRKLREEKNKLRKEKAEKRKIERKKIKEEKMRKQEEIRKQKEEEREKQKEEARIEEELLGDNLYPKTKNNKNL